MKTEIASIIKRMEIVNSGEPWFGRSVFAILEEVDSKKAFIHPVHPGGEVQHSLVDLLYHMITWAEFTLNRLEKNKIKDLAAAEELDWRTIDPKIHSWKKGLAEFKSIHKNIVAILGKKDDEFLTEIVDYRKYNFRFLLNGMIEHNIYHLGQIAYVKKMLD